MTNASGPSANQNPRHADSKASVFDEVADLELKESGTVGWVRSGSSVRR